MSFSRLNKWDEPTTKGRTPMNNFQPAAVFLLLIIAPGIAGGMDLGTIGLLPGAVALLCTALAALLLVEASYHPPRKKRGPHLGLERKQKNVEIAHGPQE